MAKRKRPIEEINRIKEHILSMSVDLIVSEGYSNFSMRKLAKKIGMSATAIYDYFDGKESLYLHVLIAGFDELTDLLEIAEKETNNKKDRFKKALTSIINFGIEKNNLYNIMFVYKVPKYKDFIGTSYEGVAKQELTSAMAFRDSFQNLLTECKDVYTNKDTPIFDMLFNIALEIHGFISFYNSQVLDYITGDVINVDRANLIDNFLSNICNNR